MTDFEGSNEVLYVTNIFDLRTFDNEILSKFFEISIEMQFVSYERNIATPLLMIHLKYTVVHYTNLNSSLLLIQISKIHFKM